MYYNRGMNVKAVGAYIAALVDYRDLKTQDVTVAAGVSPNYIWRLKNGRIASPGAETLTALVRAAGGSTEHLQRLLMDDATEQEAIRLAVQWMQQYRAEAASMTDEELDTAIREFEHEARDDRSLLQAWKGFLAGWRAQRD